MSDNDQKTNLSDPLTVPLTTPPVDANADSKPTSPSQSTSFGDTATFPGQQTTPPASTGSATPTDTSILNPNPQNGNDPANPPTQPPDNSEGSVVTSTHVPEKYGGKKIIATIFSVLFIAGAVVAGVTLVQRQQLLEQQAHEHKVIICHVPPGNPENAQEIEVDKNAWESGHDPHNAHSLDFLIKDENKDGIDDEDENRRCPPVTPTPKPTATPTPEGTSTPTPTQVPGTTATPTPEPSVTKSEPGISAQCNNVIAYDSEGGILALSDLANLNPGDTITFAVSGETNSGTFSKARFTVNGTSIGETTTKNSNGEYTLEYTIPDNVATFTVKGELYHSSLGWI